MKHAALIILMFLLLIGMDPALSQQPQFRIYPDIAKFRGDTTYVYTELYYSFDVSVLKYIPVKDGYQSEVLMTVILKRSSDDSIFTRQAWRIPFGVNDTTLLGSSRMYVDVVGLFVKPDLYRLYITGRDLNSAVQKDSQSYNIDIKSFDQQRIALSDVELCSSIVPAEQDSSNRFIKNTYEVKPNPSRIYGASQPVLFYYLETYHLLKKSSPSYFTKTIVTNAVGKEIISSEKTRRRVNESSVEVGTVKINQLRTGSYTFNFQIYDSVDNQKYISSKRFFVYNPSLPADTTLNNSALTVMGSEYATMTEQELDREFDQSRYLAKKEDISRYSKLSGVDAKRKVLFEFWQRIDPDLSTPENEKKKEYFSRIDYANQNYKSGYREGWKTDRGRVFIMYGPPDEIERHANEVDVKPYELWFYNQIQGGVQFVFGDRTGFSDYILLHSTHRDELHDDNWMRQIQTQ